MAGGADDAAIHAVIGVQHTADGAELAVPGDGLLHICDTHNNRYY